MESWDQEALCKLCLKPSKVVKMTACYTLVPEENGTASAGSKQRCTKGTQDIANASQAKHTVALGPIAKAFTVERAGVSGSEVVAPPRLWPQAVVGLFQCFPVFRKGAMFLLHISVSWKALGRPGSQHRHAV